jgi:membrane protease YdiL (CAAX protease family)
MTPAIVAISGNTDANDAYIIISRRTARSPSATHTWSSRMQIANMVEEVGIPIAGQAGETTDPNTLFSKQSLIFLMISFRLSVMFALVSRFSKYIPLKRGFCGSEDERLIVKRIIGILALIAVLFVVLRVVFGDNEAARMFFNYLRFDLTVLNQTLTILAVNSVLFVGNLYYYFAFSSLREKMQSEYQESRLKWFKTYLIAPILEESVYCGMLFASYTKLGLTGNLNFLLSSSICFGLSHVHMKWEEIKEIFKVQQISVFKKIKEAFVCCIGIVIQATIFSLYAKIVFLKFKNVWPCIFLHGYCNMLGGPKMGFPRCKTYHIIGIISSITLLYLI